MEQFSQVANQPRVITCVYCGQAYPQDTPTWGDKILTEHIKVCEKHPMRKAEETIRSLRKALLYMVGAFTKEGLEHKKKSFEERIDKDAQDKFLYDKEIEVLKININAMRILLETMEYGE